MLVRRRKRKVCIIVQALGRAAEDDEGSAGATASKSSSLLGKASTARALEANILLL